MPIYMNWGNSVPPKIKGTVTAAGHVGWIELTSVQFGARNYAAAPTDSGRGSSPAASEIVITKNSDSSSVALYSEASRGEATTVLLHYMGVQKGKPSLYLEWKLMGVLISGYSATGRGRETLTLNFTRFEWGKMQGVTPYTSAPPPW
jgi:type VI secretion system secreted protein Hcp